MSSVATSSSNSKNLSINVKLTEDNYSMWVYNMKPMLADEKLLDETDSKVVQVVDSSRALRAIQLNISEALVPAIMHYATAPKVWTYLFETYSGANRSRMFTGIKKLALIKFEKGSLKENLLQLELLIRNTTMAAGAETIKIEDLALAMFMDCLPETYNSVRSILEQNGTANTLSAVKKVLIAEDERITMRANSKAPGFAGGVKRKGNPAANCPHGRPNTTAKPCWTCEPSTHPSKQTCTDCKKYGHVSMRSNKCEKHSDNAPPAAALAHGAPPQQTDEEKWTPTPFVACVAHEHADKKRKFPVCKRNDLRVTLNATKRADHAKGGR
jgi:hypothetical protein